MNFGMITLNRNTRQSKIETGLKRGCFPFNTEYVIEHWLEHSGQINVLLEVIVSGFIAQTTHHLLVLDMRILVQLKG